MYSGMTPTIAIFLGSFGGGGIEGAFANLAHGLIQKGLIVDLVLSQVVSEEHLKRLPPETRIINLKAPKLYRSLPRLVGYLREKKPVAMLSASHYTNEIAVLAKQLSGVSTRVVVCEQNQFSIKVANGTKLKHRLMPFFAKHFYPRADGIVAVSGGVADDLAQMTGISRERIQVIYNPVLTPEVLEKSKKPLDHPWFNPGEPPVILGVGKLQAQKDFPTLIRAFAEVQKVQSARLMILGWGPDKPQLEALIRDLDLENDVELAGFQKNPHAYMAQSKVFVLSSAWEGLGNVLIEAMAAGSPVVSTDCPSGPAEILDNGKYGFLTPVGDSKALAEAILKTLSGESKKHDPAWLEQFTLDNVIRQYIDIFGLQKYITPVPL